MSLEKKLKLALDENRLLILGAQVLFGFQFNVTFQELFKELPAGTRYTACGGLAMMVITIAFLITPSMHHRIVEGGRDSPGMLSIATFFAGSALLPFAAALACDVFVPMERIVGRAGGVAAGAAFFVLAILAWYGLAYVFKQRSKSMTQAERGRESTPLSARIEQMLTEARVILPGAQALLGFQLAVTLTRAFQELAEPTRIAHAAALCCLALTVVLLMAPAALHRIAFGGEDDPTFFKIGSAFVTAAPLPLAIGIALDAYIAAGRALQAEPPALALGAAAAVVLFGFWYAYPLARRWLGGGRDAR